MEYFRTRFPWITRLLGWLLRQRLARIDREYFSGVSLHQDFLANKTYRLLIYQKTA
ncbi:MAG: hypothetical protein IIB42_08945 [Candidatus Marinimicrobia bacterium]|nr:hypothetical protein [Candidatus Neomarinimicrobiota bacterium]